MLKSAIVILSVALSSALAARRPPPNTVFFASVDVSQSAFNLVRAAINSSTLALRTTVLTTVDGWVLIQGDATAYDAANNTYYATLSNASDTTGSSALFAFDTNTGAVRFRFDFRANFTLGMMAWEATTSKVVGLCGGLMVDGSIDSFCAFDPVAQAMTPLHTFSPVNGNRYFYDPDTRALDTSRHLYYARLYTEPQGPWMPDNIVTLDSITGAVLNAVYGGGPEYAGTRFDTTSGTLWSGSNAPGGIDLCEVDPTTGATNPTGAWVQTGNENKEIMAATAAIDSTGGWYFTQVVFGDSGLIMTAVDITNANISQDRILYNVSVPRGGLISNLHVSASDPDN
jgi:hypothetical protein